MQREEGDRVPPAPQSVVISYGAADVAESWELVRRLLEPRVAVVIPKRVRGDDPVAHLAAAIRDQPAPPVVIGHSYGGILARAAADAAGSRVAGLVLVDATSSRVARSVAARTVLGGSALALRLATGLAGTGLGRRLLDGDAVRFIPEEPFLRRAVTPEFYAAWRDAIRRNIVDGTAAGEMADVVTAAARYASLPPSMAPVTVIHSRGMTRMLERPHPDFTRAAAHVAATGDRFHNIHVVHPEVVVRAVREVGSETGE